MVHAGPYLKQVRDRLRQRGIDLYLIADVVYSAPPESFDWALLKEHFQAITAYNMYYRPEFLDKTRGSSRRVIGWPGKTDWPSSRMSCRVTTIPASQRDRAALDRQGGSFYRSFWNIASPFVSAKQPFLFITTFNEWHEGTELEPSLEHGDSLYHAHEPAHRENKSGACTTSCEIVRE